MDCILYYEFVSLPQSQILMEKYFDFESSRGTPRLKDILMNVSVTFVNSHYTFGYPTPFFPNVVETAGLHIAPQEPLPLKLQKFIDEAIHGIIYVSLGSLIQPEDLKTIGESFTHSLKDLPQKVIFKWNKTLLEDTPRNFLVQSWIPQVEVLRHPNCKLFITHGGRHSLLESLNASVPLVGIPFYADQQHNLAIIEHHEIGKKVDIDQIKEELLPIVKEVLGNPMYKTNMKIRSRLFNERLRSPMDTAIFWIEQILENKNTEYLKSGASYLSWYQYFLVDIFLVVIVTVILLTYTFYFSLKYILKWVFAKSEQQKKTLRKPCNLKYD